MDIQKVIKEEVEVFFESDNISRNELRSYLETSFPGEKVYVTVNGEEKVLDFTQEKGGEFYAIDPQTKVEYKIFPSKEVDFHKIGNKDVETSQEYVSRTQGEESEVDYLDTLKSVDTMSPFGESVKKSDLKQLVTETLQKELKKRQLEKRLHEVNAQLKEYKSQEPDHIDDELEVDTAAANASGAVTPEQYKAYSMDFDPNETSYDYFEIGADYDGRVSGSYRPATLEEPAEYPEIEIEYDHWYIKNQETGQWEDLTDDHIALKADPGIKETFEEANREVIEKKIADGNGPDEDVPAHIHRRYHKKVGQWIK